MMNHEGKANRRFQRAAQVRKGHTQCGAISVTISNQERRFLNRRRLCRPWEPAGLGDQITTLLGSLCQSILFAMMLRSFGASSTLQGGLHDRSR